MERLPIWEGQALKTLYIIGNGFDIAHGWLVFGVSSRDRDFRL